jgi:hypothetical protein
MPSSKNESDTAEQLALPRGEGIDLFAASHSESIVAVWSFAKRKKVAEFNTSLDFGGLRLTMGSCASSDIPIISTGSWRNGLTSYTANDGTVLWTRSDLRKIQQVCDLSGGKQSLIGVGLNSGPYHILSADTGKDQLKLTGIKTVYASSFDPVYLLQDNMKHVHLSTFQMPSIWKKALISFALLHAAFSPKQIAFSEAGGSVSCFDFYGTKLWEFLPQADHHILRLVWASILQRWLAIDWNFRYGGSKRLFEIDADGKARMVMTIGDCQQAEFTQDGTHLVTSAGEIISTQSAATVWTFE